MKTELWKNQMSSNLKKAIEEEIQSLLTNEQKQIAEENKRLRKENIRLVNIIKKLKNV